MRTQDIAEQLRAQVLTAIENRTPLRIRGGGSKDFYGRPPVGDILDTRPHQGIIHYEPTELVISARAGTPLKVIEETLAQHNQMLPFEPPAFGVNATLGGTIACNLSGPRRPWVGAARDFVLGTRVLNGKGEILSFGGEVMKNVAGYDVSRLMTGAMGTLGVLLEVSLKVLPRPEQSTTLVQPASLAEAQQTIAHWSARPLPLSAICFHGDSLYVRLAGSPNSVSAASRIMGGEQLPEGEAFWQAVREQRHDFFSQDRPLWRISLAADAGELALEGDTFYDWGGALRWLYTDAPVQQVRQAAQQYDGHATLFRAMAPRDEVFHPLPDQLMRLHRTLKQAFDPHRVFNPGRMYGHL